MRWGNWKFGNWKWNWLNLVRFFNYSCLNPPMMWAHQIISRDIHIFRSGQGAIQLSCQWNSNNNPENSVSRRNHKVNPAKSSFPYSIQSTPLHPKLDNEISRKFQSTNKAKGKNNQLLIRIEMWKHFYACGHRIIAQHRLQNSFRIQSLFSNYICIKINVKLCLLGNNIAWNSFPFRIILFCSIKLVEGSAITCGIPCRCEGSVEHEYSILHPTTRLGKVIQK